MDDNTSHLVEAQIDRQLRKDPSTYMRNGGSWIPKGIQDALIIASILGLAASVWNWKESIAVLRTTQEFQQRQMDRIERRQDTLEGRITRGGPNAPNQQ